MTDCREHFPHGARIDVRGIGATLVGAFEQATVALTAIVIDPAALAMEETRDFACSAPDVELLLVDWLNAQILEADDLHQGLARGLQAR